jgi:hypothetical protein
MLCQVNWWSSQVRAATIVPPTLHNSPEEMNLQKHHYAKLKPREITNDYNLTSLLEQLAEYQLANKTSPSWT